MEFSKIKIIKGLRYLLLSCVMVMGLISIIATGGGDGGDDSGGSSADTVTDSGTGTLSISLTDAFTDEYKAVYVTIQEVSVHTSVDEENEGEEQNNGENEGEETGSWEVIEGDGIPGTYDLLELRDGLLEPLGIVELEAGHYTQIRLLLGLLSEEADGELNRFDDPHEYPNYVVFAEDENNTQHELKVPSGYQTGIKLVHGFDIESDLETSLILDFDASKSVHKAGKSGQILLKPTIKVINEIVGRMIEGMVLYEEEGEEPIGVEGVYVTAQTYDASEGVDPKDKVVINNGSTTDTEGNFSMMLETGIDYYLVAYRDYSDSEGDNNYLPACQEINVDAESDIEAPEIYLEISDTSGTIYGEVTFTDVGAEAQPVRISFRQPSACEVDEGVQMEITWIDVTDFTSDVDYNITLPAGTYTLVASTENYDTYETTVEIYSETDFELNLEFSSTL